MLVALADENAGNEESIMAQVDVIRLARKFIKANPGSCKVPLVRPVAPLSKFARKDEQHVHGSQSCLRAFLGVENWGNDKMHKLSVIISRP
jgi:hypothetical protein